MKKTVKLAKPKTCSCGRVFTEVEESKILAGDGENSKVHLWFNCECNSTLFAQRSIEDAKSI